MIDIDVAVIGAGIIGSAIAAALVEKGLNTGLIDSGRAGNQSASKYSGGINRIYDHDIKLSQLSIYQKFNSNSVVPTVIRNTSRKTGLLFVGIDENKESVRTATGQLSNQHYPIKIVDKNEAKKISRFPDIADDELSIYEPNATLGNARAGASLLANYVKDAGLLLENTRVKAVTRRPNGFCIHTNSVKINAKIVVLACGSFAKAIIDYLPLKTRSIPLVRVSVNNSTKIPIIHSRASTYVVPLYESLLHIGSEVREEADFSYQLKWDEFDKIESDALSRLDTLTGNLCSSSSTGAVLDILQGYDCYTPDRRPVIGTVNDQNDCFVATGFSGLGYKMAVPVAAAVSDQIEGQLTSQAKQSSDVLASFSPNRFQI